MASSIEATSGRTTIPVPSIQSETEGKEQKLDLRAIFQAIGNHVCCVYAGEVKSSGILLGDREVLVTFHSISPICDSTRTFHEYISVKYRDRSYLAEWSSTNILKKVEYYDCCLFQIIDEDFPKVDSVTPFLDPISPGEEVYFAGYPLTQEDPSFHRGTVSSFRDRDGLTHFNIDASVLPGNSGGPVFIKKGQTVLLAGVIFAELASIDNDFVKKRESISAKLTSGGKIAMNGVAINQVLVELMNTVLDNLSTGIGKVLGVRHIKNITDEGEIPIAETPFHLGFPVGRKKIYNLFKPENVVGKYGGEQSYILRKPDKGVPGIIIDSHQKNHITDWVGNVKQSGTQFPFGFSRDQFIELSTLFADVVPFLKQKPLSKKKEDAPRIHYFLIAKKYKTDQPGPQLKHPYIAIHSCSSQDLTSWEIHLHPDDGRNVSKKNRVN